MPCHVRGIGYLFNEIGGEICIILTDLVVVNSTKGVRGRRSGVMRSEVGDKPPLAPTLIQRILLTAAGTLLWQVVTREVAL